MKKEPTLLFKFRAKFYPEDVQEEIIQDITLVSLLNENFFISKTFFPFTQKIFVFLVIKL